MNFPDIKIDIKIFYEFEETELGRRSAILISP